MNALRALLLLPALAALAACGGSDRSAGAQANNGVTVELPPFEPEQYAGVVEDENAATSLNVMVPAASEGEPPPAAKPEPKVAVPEPKAPPAELAKAPAKVAPVPTPKGTAAATPAPAASPAANPTAKTDTTAPRTPAVTARLPLSTERVASTIDRIGYPCGQVTGATPVDGASIPTWKIDCSSGATYRGTNRGGHMRFRKWSGN